MLMSGMERGYPAGPGIGDTPRQCGTIMSSCRNGSGPRGLSMCRLRSSSPGALLTRVGRARRRLEAAQHRARTINWFQSV